MTSPEYGNVSVTTRANGTGHGQLRRRHHDAAGHGKTANSVSSLNLGASSGGTLGALNGLTSPSGQVAGYLTTLNSFANTLASSVNAIHTTPPFFSVATSTTALGATATTLNVAPGLVSIPTVWRRRARAIPRPTMSPPGSPHCRVARPTQATRAFVSQVGLTCGPTRPPRRPRRRC